MNWQQASGAAILNPSTFQCGNSSWDKSRLVVSMTQFAIGTTAPSEQSAFVVDGKAVIASASYVQEHYAHTISCRDINLAWHEATW